MPVNRTIERVVPATVGPKITRIIGTVDIDGNGTLHELAECDPCILLDQGIIRQNEAPPFGKHPHRGHSVVTILMQGKVKSWDSFSQKVTTFSAPASYWVDAGSGLFHDEKSVIEDESDPKQFPALFQLWIGIPEADRQKQPAVQHAENLKTNELPDGVGTLCYHVGGDSGINTTHPLTVARIRQNPNTTYRFPVDPSHGGFIINLSGAEYVETPSNSSPASFAGTTPEKENDVLILSQNDGDGIEIKSQADAAADYMIVVGEKHGEKWYKKLAANGAIIAASPEEARKIGKEVEEYSKSGKADGGSFAPFGAEAVA